jgi:aryl carrier-like protein
MERRSHHSLPDLLQQDQYTPEEVAELLEIGLDVVRHAAFSGELRAGSPSTKSSAFAATISWPE